MTREERIELIKHLKYNRSIGADYSITDKDVDEIIKALEQEPCEDCISRQAAIEAFGLSEKSRKYGGDHSGYDTLMKYEIQYILEDLPSVTPQAKTGHWILADVQNKEDVVNDNFRFICSECLCSDIHAKNTIVPYCWKCGAKMKEVEE